MINFVLVKPSLKDFNKMVLEVKVLKVMDMLDFSSKICNSRFHLAFGSRVACLYSRVGLKKSRRLMVQIQSLIIQVYNTYKSLLGFLLT